MAKTREELNKIKIEIETLNKKLTELNDDELKQIIGGTNPETIKEFMLFNPTKAVSKPATMFDETIPIRKVIFNQAIKINELTRTIEKDDEVIVYNSSEPK